MSTPLTIDAPHPGEALNPPGQSRMDPQVTPGHSPFGNRYSRAFKLMILQQADACTQPGQLGKLLKSASITHTTLTTFRKQRAAGTLDAPDPKSKRPPVEGPPVSADIPRVLELERQNRQLTRRLLQAEALIDIQKKVSHLLESTLSPSEDGSK